MNQNEHYEELFQNFDKADAFDKIAELFYNRNFSSASKSEIELLMFHFYMKAMIEANKKDDGTIDYPQCSDYEISKQLGITQEKVRGLKIKKQARYPEAFDWQKSLMSIKDNIRLDDNAKRIIIPIPDPNLNAEIRNFISQKGGYIDFESGKDYIRIRVEYYLLLTCETFNESEKKKFIKETRKALHKANEYENDMDVMDAKQVVSDVLSVVGTGLDVVDRITQIVNPKNALIDVLHSAISKKLGIL